MPRRQLCDRLGELHDNSVFAPMPRIEKAFGDAGVEFKRLQTGGFTMFVRLAAAGRTAPHPKLSPPRREAR
jgi:hypothetical protein